MSLFTTISAIVTEHYPESSFFLASQFQSNVDLLAEPSTGFPVVILDNMLTDESQFMENNNLITSERIMITVLFLDEFDTKDMACDSLVELAKEMLDKIYSNIYLLDAVTESFKFKKEPFIKGWAGLYTGATGLATVKYNAITNICLTAPDEEEGG